MIARARSDDERSITVLVLGYFLVCVLLVTVVVNVSKVLLVRRSLAGAADGAAVAASNGLDERQIYRGNLGEAVPLSDVAAGALVEDYADAAGLAAQFDRFQVVAVDTDGEAATVTFAAVVPLPFVNLLSADYADGVPLTATASARSAVR